jgi:hypothetical protein
MRGRGKLKKNSIRVVAVPEGLQIEDDERFYKDIRTALTDSLGAGFLAQTTKQIGQRQLVYIRQPSSPTVQGREGPLPALPIFIDDRQSAWLVVEIESEYGKPLMLKHVSLKLWQGATADAAHLCFRAEWDVRGTESSHAQPHWNVHAPRGMIAQLAPELDFQMFSGLEQAKEISSFAEFEQAEAVRAVHPEPTNAPAYGLSVEQMHKFHFAMASNWHMSNGTTGPSISTTQEVVTWISSCALYIKHQFAFVMES